MDFAAFFMTFLSDDWVFFQEGEITWDGKRHAINGLQVNAAKVDGFMPFISENSDFDSIKEALDYFVAFLTNIETDEEFAIPRSSIAPGVAKGLLEGDLTPITFANLAACGSALIVREVGDDDYAVLFDRRLAQGIPCFFNLSARLIWDFRQLTRSGRGVPFKVGFLPTRSIDADACFDESVDVVPGAQDDILVMDVDCAPEISIVAKQSGSRLDTLKACLNTLDPERFAEIEGSPGDSSARNLPEGKVENSKESMADVHKRVEQGNRTEKKSAAIDIEVARERGLAVVRELAPKLEEHIESRLAEKRRLSSELSSLGLFKFGEKKAKKAEIAEAGRSVHRWCMLRLAWGEVENWLRICDLAGNYKARKERFREFTSEADVENKTKFILLSSSVLLYMADMQRPVASGEVGKFIVELTGDVGYKCERIMEWLADEYYVRRIEGSKGCTYELRLGVLEAGSYFLENPCHQINFMIQKVFSEYDKFDWENSAWRY